MKVQNSMSIVSEKTGMPTYTIYKIMVLDRVYIGKTKDFEKRRSDHINKCHNKDDKEYNKPLYKHIREMEEKGEFKFDESHFEIIEVIDDYEDEEDILYCEKAWFEFYRDDLKIEMLNVLRPIINEEERKELNNKKSKKHYEENRDKINRKARERYAKKKEAQRQVQNSHVSDVPKDSS